MFPVYGPTFCDSDYEMSFAFRQEGLQIFCLYLAICYKIGSEKLLWTQLSNLSRLFQGVERLAKGWFMNEQNNTQVNASPYPPLDDRAGWQAYWQQQGLLWRSEPEITSERQQYLAERRAVAPDVMQGMYSFRDIKLSRADVEWLLATHENGRGPVDYSDESQRQRVGLDLRGADLRGVW